MKGIKLTKRTVDAAKAGPRDVFLWDKEIPGFGLKVTPMGRRVYVFQYSLGDRDRRMTIGMHGAPWTPSEAREKARSLRGEVADGRDPATIKQDARGIPTLAEFEERYLKEHAEVKKKPSSLRNDTRMLKDILVPRLGHRKLSEITREEVTRLHLILKDTPYHANRVLALLSKMMNLAERWGLRPDGTNPCRHVEKFRERRRERFMSEKELAKLGEVLAKAEQAGPDDDGWEPPVAIAAIRLLLLTGCRVSEILTLQWAHVDRERGFLRLPDSKTGARAIPLSQPALDLLAALPRIVGNPYVLPGRGMQRHFGHLSHSWSRMRGTAGIPDVRLHDLRHSFASVGAAGGESLVILGAILGHREAATTARYAHLSDDPVRAAADRISSRIAAALGGRS